jgi:hypothetical protein
MSRPSSRVTKSMLFGSGLLALGKRDFLLASYPRSGSTWTRHFLCNLISLSERGGSDVAQSVNDVMPALGTSNLLESWPHTTIPRVIKTHAPYSRLFWRASAIGLIRDPRDVMVSRYHLLRDRVGTFNGTFNEFMRDPELGLETWFRHYVSWRDHWGLVIRYEDMLANPQREFSRLLDEIGADCPEDMVRKAIERSSFQHMQDNEKQRKPTAHQGGLFYRSGSSGQWAGYFSDDDFAEYADSVSKFDVDLYD